MTTARMLSRWIWLPLIAAGCNTDMSGTWGSKSSSSPQPADQQVVSEPVPLDIDETPDATSDDAVEIPAPATEDPPANTQIAAYLENIQPVSDEAIASEDTGDVPQVSPLPASSQTTSRPAQAAAEPSTSEEVQSVAEADTNVAEPAVPAEPPAPVVSVVDIRPVTNTPVAASDSKQTTQPATKPLVNQASLASPAPTDQADIAPTNKNPRPNIDLIDIRPATPDSTEVAIADKAAPNQPINNDHPTDDVGQLIQSIKESLAANPDQVDLQLKLRLLYLALGKSEDLKAFHQQPGDSTNKDEIMAALSEAIRSSKALLTSPDASASEAVLAVEELHRLISQEAPVTIPKVELVTAVNSFGDYVAIRPLQFPQGKQIRAYLYTEVENFKSEPTAEGRVRTLLSQRVEVYNSQGQRVWHRFEPELEDRVLSPRRDFYIPFPVTLPASLPAGQYILKVTVEDKIGQTTDQRRLTFQIGY